MPVIEVKGLAMSFGGLRALTGIDLQVDQGEIVALIGPNGAGKTTFFNCVTGIYRPSGGEVFLAPDGKKPQRITGLKPNTITAGGIARTFQNIRLFSNMTVLENILVARHCRTRSGILGAIFRGKKIEIEEREAVRFSYRLLERFGLARYVNDPAGGLPYGDQRRLEIARAMATEPKLLLLDEPAAGMNHQETEALTDLIRGIRDEDGIAILLIEHDMRLVMRLSERIYVVDHGEMIAQGRPADIAVNPKVITAYLGSGFHA
jgi:branched-chain amino acid transport system ATP-binding protein